MTNMIAVEQSGVRVEVMKAIEHYIVSKNLSAGDIMPSERELAEALNCSRNTIRAAYKILEGRGMLDIKPGRGAFISRLGLAELMERFYPILAKEMMNLRALAEARLPIEVEIVELAIDRITPEEVGKLEGIIEKFKDTQTLGEETQVDLEFHQAIVDIVDSPLLGEISLLFRRFFLKTLERDIARYGAGDVRKCLGPMASYNIAEHMDLLNAIRKKDRKKAREITRRHLLSYIEGDGNPVWEKEVGHVQPGQRRASERSASAASAHGSRSSNAGETA